MKLALIMILNFQGKMFRYLSREMPKALPQNLKSRRIAQLETYSSCVPRSQVKSIFSPAYVNISPRQQQLLDPKGSHTSPEWLPPTAEHQRER